MTFQELIDYFGSQQKAAAKLGIKQPSISRWQKTGIRYLRQLDIERITKGALRANPNDRAKDSRR